MLRETRRSFGMQRPFGYDVIAPVNYFFAGAAGFAGFVAAAAVPMLISSALYIFIFVSMCASMTTRAPTFKSVFFPGLLSRRYFVVFSSIMTTGLLSLSLMVTVSAATAVTVPMMGSPCAIASPVRSTKAVRLIKILFNMVVFSFNETLWAVLVRPYNRISLVMMFMC